MSTEEEIENLYNILEKIIELDCVIGLKSDTVEDCRSKIIERAQKLENTLEYGNK